MEQTSSAGLQDLKIAFWLKMYEEGLVMYKDKPLKDYTWVELAEIIKSLDSNEKVQSLMDSFLNVYK